MQDVIKQRKTKLNTDGIEGKRSQSVSCRGNTKRGQRPQQQQQQQSNGICVKGQLQFKDALLLNKLGNVDTALQFCRVASQFCGIIRKTKNYGNSDLLPQYLSLFDLNSWCPTFLPQIDFQQITYC